MRNLFQSQALHTARKEACYKTGRAIKLDLPLQQNLPFVCLLQLFKQKACKFSKFQINVLALISIALFTPVIS